MSIERLFQGGAVPSESRIDDLAVVEFDGRPLVVCVSGPEDVWTWDVLKDEWTERPLEPLREYDEEDEEDEDETDEHWQTLPAHSDDMLNAKVARFGGRTLVASVTRDEVQVTDLERAE
ncbi:hypothetical protein AB0L06_16705 [Spirillospora sp. NPDC052269]